MDVVVVAVLALAALFKFRMARLIARSPMGQGRRGIWMVRSQQFLGVTFLLVAVAWLLWRRSAS